MRWCTVRTCHFVCHSERKPWSGYPRRTGRISPRYPSGPTSLAAPISRMLPDLSARSRLGVMATEDLMRKALEALGEVDGPMSIEVIHRLVDAGDVEDPMSIAEVSDLLDVSAHTLRYYEKIGLVTVDRDSSGHRVYGPESIRRLVFLTRMRISGMAIRDLQHYVELVDAGEGTVPERLDMLLEHRDTVRRQIKELTLSLAATEYKIATYGGRTGEQE